MITGATKNKVDDIWQKMWEGGITNPLEVISQLTYLMFMHQLDEREFEAESLETMLGTEQRHIFPQSYTNAVGIEIPGDELRWSRFKDKPAETMYHTVSEFAFPFIKTLGDGSAFTRSMESATFGIPTPKTLQRAVDGIDALFEGYVDDISDLGDLYEYMLSKLNSQKTVGQFRTPKHIRDMMVRLIDPKPGQLICDPAMGTAGFLISAAEYLRRNHEEEMTPANWDMFTGEDNGACKKEGKEFQPQFTGFEIDQTMLRISTMNLMLHGVRMPDVRYLDSISKNNTVHSKFDCILANPPFTGSVDAEDIDGGLKTIVDSKKTELLFVALFLRMLHAGGRCACIVPSGVLSNNNAKAYRQLRKELVDKHKLEAIIYLPAGVFSPYSKVSTAVLVFTKTDAGGTDDVWLYNMEGDGFTLDDKREPDEDHNDIPDILERWSNLGGECERARTEKSFLISRAEIVENDYDFSFNKYTKTVYKCVEYPPTEEILADLEAINQRIADGLAELKMMLGGGQGA